MKCFYIFVTQYKNLNLLYTFYTFYTFSHFPKRRLFIDNFINNYLYIILYYITMVKVRDMIVDKKYLVGGVTKTLTQKDLAGSGGQGPKNRLIIYILIMIIIIKLQKIGMKITRRF